MSGILYIVGTPIGNLSDMSPRAVQTLSECDFIAAEDTRVTVKLLNHFNIKKPMVSYYEHNKHERGVQILERIENGENCALVTDAGMPAISDPGEDLVAACHERGIVVKTVPGPCAFVTALALSGLPVGRFTFEGFLSVNKPSRREHLESIKYEKRTMIFYEAPHKLSNTLTDLAKTLGSRKVAIVRELTKIHEEVIRTTLPEAAELYANNVLKGEIVLVIEGCHEEEKKTGIDEAVNAAKKLTENGISVNEAAKITAKQTGLKKGDIYKCLLEEK